MKKIIFIVCSAIICFSLTAFGFINWGQEGSAPEISKVEGSASYVFDMVGDMINPLEVEFVYEIDTRFIATITKEKLHAAKTIRDILPEKTTSPTDLFENVKVAVIHDEEISEPGKDANLNPAQLQLLQSTDYSQNIMVRADYKSEEIYSIQASSNYISYYMTIVPEQEAEYLEGKDALIRYLKEGSISVKAGVEKSQLKPGMIGFTVSKNGELTHVELNSSSGYPDIDKTMLELMEAIPGKWKPAKNAKGENVDQTLIFFFGQMGC